MKALLVSLTLLPLALHAQLTHSETIQRTFAAPRLLDVNNIFGSVHVIGTAGAQIQLTALRTDEASTRELLDKAAKEVTLKTEEKDGELRIYPDGPFHDHDWHPGYKFKFDITVNVPQSLTLHVRNVTRGGVTVENVRGHLDIRNVNGGVDMKGIGGEGEVRSVNGPLHVGFSSNPTGAWNFKTVNGPIEVAFVQGLSADLKYKTVHGGIFTDFDVNATPSRVAGQAEQKNGRFVYRSHGYASGRIGSGGPLLTFETVNGEIRILKK